MHKLKKHVLFFALLLLALSIFAQNPTETPELVTAKIIGNEIHATFHIPENQHITLQKEYFYIELAEIAGLSGEETIYPEGQKSAEGEIEYHGNVTLIKTFHTTSEFSANQITFYAGHQICLDTGSCLRPDEVEFSLDYENATEKETDTPKPKAKATTNDIIKFLFMAFIGGIILNIMPCVLPVLSIKAMSLVKQSQQDRKQIFYSSMAYTAGIVVSFIILATVIVVLKASGEMVGWGFQFQSAGFVTALLIMIFVFALSMFDVFIIRAPGMQTATKASSKNGLMGSFASGIFAVLLATPCTAPLLGAALGFAFSQPPVMIYAIFILIGIGLALPFIILGVWPKAIKAIPRPGEWMNVFKEVMGFLLFLTALYLLRSLYFLIGGLNLISVLLYLIILAFATWIYGRFAKPYFSTKRQMIATVIALLVAIGGGFLTLNFDVSEETLSMESSHYPRNWEKFSPEILQDYRDQGIPVFVDFGAEWCLTCKTNEETVLFTDDIEAAFKKNGVKQLRGDNTKKDDTIVEWLGKFNRAGVPLYIFYTPGAKEAIVLPELITKSMVLNMLDKLKEQ